MIELLTHNAELFITFLLTVSTFGLWFSTARMNHIEKVKLTDVVKNDNDNITDVALKIENDRHVERLHELKRVQRKRNR